MPKAAAVAAMHMASTGMRRVGVSFGERNDRGRDARLCAVGGRAAPLALKLDLRAKMAHE